MGRWNSPHSTSLFLLVLLHAHIDTYTYANAYSYIVIYLQNVLQRFILLNNPNVVHRGSLFIIAAYWAAALLIKNNHSIIHLKFFMYFIFP